MNVAARGIFSYANAGDQSVCATHATMYQYDTPSTTNGCVRYSSPRIQTTQNIACIKKIRPHIEKAAPNGVMMV